MNTQGAQVRRRRRRLLVESPDSMLQAVRLREVKRVVLAGNVQITTPALQALLREGVETTLLSGSGRLLGVLRPPGARNVFRRLAQFQRYQDLEFRLGVARTVVQGKIQNSRRLLQLFSAGRDRAVVDVALNSLQMAARQAGEAQALPKLMGIEGAAAAAYFKAYGGLFLKEMRFEGRNRRPPRDPVNSLLSFGYTLLTGEALGALAGQGLDPDVGFFHEVAYGRPSLALDLVEEFRQPVVDRFVLSTVNRRVFTAEDFEAREEGGFYLNDAARTMFFSLYERLMTNEFKLRDGRKAHYRALLFEQAGRLGRVVMDGGDYVPFRMP